MSFLFHILNGFLITDYKPRQGLYFQNYTKEGFSKPTSILPYATPTYSAALDSEQNLHVVAENNKNQIFYIDYRSSPPSKRIILEDLKHTYHFSDLHLFMLSGTPYLFYTVKHPTGNSRSLMWQALDQSTPSIHTLVSYIPEGCQVKLYLHTNQVYIIYTDFDEGYLLKMITFSPLSHEPTTLIYSQIPIVDYNLCYSPSGLHLVLQKDAYGKHQLSYLLVGTGQEQSLDTPSTISSPCIFSYCQALWITYMSQDTLYVMLSHNRTNAFSIPVACSLQGHLTPYHFYTHTPQLLSATQMYARTHNGLRLLVVSAFDLYGIHPDLPMATELDLFFDAIGISSAPYSSANRLTPTPPLFSPTQTLPLATPQTPSTMPPLPSPPEVFVQPSPLPSVVPPLHNLPLASPQPELTPPTTRSLKSISKAFMDSSNTFELPPLQPTDHPH